MAAYHRTAALRRVDGFTLVPTEAETAAASAFKEWLTIGWAGAGQIAYLPRHGGSLSCFLLAILVIDDHLMQGDHVSLEP